METVLKLANARERLLLSASERGSPMTASVPDDLVNALVAELFELALHSNEKTVRGEGQSVNNGHALGDNLVHTDVVTVNQPNPNKKAKPNGSQGPQQNVSSQVS